MITIPEINIWSWDKVLPHLQKYLYAGRLFCFEFDANTYCFGRIMTKALVGYIAEIFDYTSPLPELNAEIVKNAKRIGVCVLDTVNLFERNRNHSWRVIGDQRNYTPTDVDGINFRIGTEYKKADFFGKVTEISQRQAEALPPLIPLGEDEIKQSVAPKIGREFTPDPKRRSAKKSKPDIELWGWEKKPRTMLRYLDAGQIFCFKFDEKKYCFGRLMTKALVGYIAEIFDFTSSVPEIGEEEIKSAKRIAVEILDVYSLFDKRTEGDWRMIGACANYIPTDVENIFFYIGIGNDLRKVDFFDRETPITKEESKKCKPLSPHGDYLIKTAIADKIK